MTEPDDPLLRETARLAREVAAMQPSLVLLHCPDAPTQALVYPEQPDLALQQALNRTIAREAAAAGARLFAQVVDGPTYAARLAGWNSTAGWRKSYRDPARLVQDDAAMALFGLSAPPARRPAPRGRTRTPADQLLRDWMDGAAATNPALSALLDAGREGVLQMAIRKLEQLRHTDAAIEDFLGWVHAAAERVLLEPCGSAELFLLPVLVRGAALPDPVRLAQGFLAADLLSPGQAVAFLPAWFDPDALAGLSPWALRRTLRAVMAGRAPPDLAAVTAADGGPLTLLGVCRDPYPVPWEVALEDLRLREDAGDVPADDADDPAAEIQDAAFQRWRQAMLAADPGLEDIFYPSTPALLAADADADGPEDVTEDEVGGFVEIAEAEAGGEALVGVPRIVDGAVELRLYTEAGRLLDARVFAPAQDGAVPDSLQRMFSRFVAVADRPPGPG